MPEKNAETKIFHISYIMRNQTVSFIQNYFRQKVAKLPQHFSNKVWENPRGALTLDVNVLALLVWVKLSWAGKTAQNSNVKSPLSSWRPLHLSDNFHLKPSFKNLVYSQSAKKVLVCFIQCGVFCSFAFFSNARSKVQFTFCPELWNCFWMRL